MGSNEAEGTKALYENFISDGFGRYNPKPSIETARALEKSVGPFLPSDQAARILEIGVGMGHFAFFATRIKGYKNYSGIDVSSECVNYVRENITGEVFLCEDTQDFLDKRPDAYDLIVMMDVIEHIPRSGQYACLKAIRRSLRDGGTFILRTENAAIFTGYYQHVMDYTHEYNFSPRGLEQLLKAVKYSDIRIFGDPVQRVTGVRSLIHFIASALWRGILKVIHEIERPGSVHPAVLTKNIYAACRK